MVEEPVRQLVPRIACPTLLIAGEDDTPRPPAVHREMAGMIGGSALLVLPRRGHMVAMEEPDAVTSAMRCWLA